MDLFFLTTRTMGSLPPTTTPMFLATASLKSPLSFEDVKELTGRNLPPIWPTPTAPLLVTWSDRRFCRVSKPRMPSSMRAWVWVRRLLCTPARTTTSLYPLSSALAMRPV